MQEMQKSFTSYKCLMISINLSGRSFLRGDGSQQEAELQDALGSANHSWTQACSSLERWERRLHAALLQCQVRRRISQNSPERGLTRPPPPCRSSTRRCTRCSCGWPRPRPGSAPPAAPPRTRPPPP